MADHPRQTIPTPAVDEAGSAAGRPVAGTDRRAVRTVDLTDSDIAAIEAAEMAPGFEYLNAELDEG